MSKAQIIAIGATLFLVFPGFTIMAVMLKGLCYMLLYQIWMAQFSEDYDG